MAHHVYILYSKTKNRFYMGSISDIDKRLKT
ncbi:MAG: GIY-YIG nuclease family protein [Bacteroidota bacterium]